MRWPIAIASLALSLSASFGFLHAAPSSRRHARPKECCFVHSSFTGVCKVTPGKDETCPGILRYLNTPSSVSKTYCDGTPLRGGWKRVACAKAPPPPRP